MAAAVGQSLYDRREELTEFDDTRAGVKGLIDSGIKQIPKIFIHQPEDLPNSSDDPYTRLQVPIIDLYGIGDDNRRRTIVEQVHEASKLWGFFQLVNHGIQIRVIDDMVQATRRFHEQEKEAKAEFYGRDLKKKVNFVSNFDLFESPAANWRDTLGCFFDGSLNPDNLPSVCREAIMEFREQTVEVADLVFQLLSEGLGLAPDYLKSINCAKTQFLGCHYYPACPQPELTLGTTKHSDPSVLTLLVQDDLGGLQVLHHDNWVDVSPVQEALVVNIGDLLQLISNDEFRSVEHRVLASHQGPRISVAVFLNPSQDEETPYGPVKELVSDENPAIYQEVRVRDYTKCFLTKGLDGESALNHFKL